MIVLDTDHFSELQRRDSQRGIRLRERLEKRGDRPVSTTIVSIEEQLRGRLSAINENPAGNKQVLAYTRLVELLDGYASWIIWSFDAIAAQRFEDLKASKVRIGTMDLKIAAIALARSATLLSANLRDFRQGPNLAVEDWLA